MGSHHFLINKNTNQQEDTFLDKKWGIRMLQNHTYFTFFFIVTSMNYFLECSSWIMSHLYYCVLRNKISVSIPSLPLLRRDVIRPKLNILCKLAAHTKVSAWCHMPVSTCPCHISSPGSASISLLSLFLNLCHLLQS